MLLTGCNSSLWSNKPPQLEVRIDDNRFTAVQGSYCWTKVCSDMASPPDIYEHVGFTPPKVIGGMEAELIFGNKPRKGSTNVHLLGEEVLPVKLQSKNSFLIPELTGEYTYLVNARWFRNRESGYYFTVIVQ